MGSAADFVSGLPSDLQESFLKYCTALVAEFRNVQSQLVDENDNPLNPILIRDACFVAFGEAMECPKLLIAPKEQLDQLRVRTGMKPSASVLLRESKAHAALLVNLNDKTAFNALMAETALKLLSGEHAVLLWKSVTESAPVPHRPDTGWDPPVYASNQTSTSSEDHVAQTRADNHSAKTNRRIIREIDSRPGKITYTGIWDHSGNRGRTKETPNAAPPQTSDAKAHDVRNDPAETKRVLRTPFCAPVIIEGPSPAIGGDKLAEDVGLTTSSGDFVVILDKFSWLPYSRTSRIPLETPTPEPVTVTFARRKSAFSSESTTLGTFLLTEFSGDDSVHNILEIRVNAVDSGLYFDVRDSAGSQLKIARQS